MRIQKLVAGLGLMFGAIGCHHVAGFCDCNPPIHPCCIYGLHPAADYSIVTASTFEKPTAPAPKADTPAVVPATPPVKAPAGVLSADPTKEWIGLPKEN